MLSDRFCGWFSLGVDVWAVLKANTKLFVYRFSKLHFAECQAFVNHASENLAAVSNVIKFRGGGFTMTYLSRSSGSRG